MSFGASAVIGGKWFIPEELWASTRTHGCRADAPFAGEDPALA
jgi:hypothetical protein